jgi:hypothetical protein
VERSWEMEGRNGDFFSYDQTDKTLRTSGHKSCHGPVTIDRATLVLDRHLFLSTVVLVPVFLREYVDTTREEYITHMCYDPQTISQYTAL